MKLTMQVLLLSTGDYPSISKEAEMSYTNAPSTKLLATHCMLCNLPLRDAKSVELGIGPTCRAKSGYSFALVPEDKRKAANAAIHRAGVAAQARPVNAQVILDAADEIEGYSLTQLADIIRNRFITLKVQVLENAEVTRWDRDAREEIVVSGKTRKALAVWTPFSRQANGNRRQFIKGRARPVKSKDTGFHWEFDYAQQRQVWAWLASNFGGQAGAVLSDGKRKVFVVPCWAEFISKHTQDQYGNWVREVKGE